MNLSNKTYLHLVACILLLMGCGRVDRPSANLMDALGDLEIEGTLRALSYNVGLSHTGMVNFVPCSGERVRELPAALAGWALLYPQLPFAMLLQEADNKKLFNDLQRTAAERGWTVVPSELSEVSSHGLVVVTNEDVLASEFIPFDRDRDGYRRGMLRVQILVDNNVLDIFNTQTTASNADRVDELHASQLNQILRTLEATPVQGKAILAGDLNFGPSVQLNLEEGEEALDITSSYMNWLVGRLPAWWHWSFPEDSLSEDFLTWNPEVNSLAKYPTTAASLWRRMRHRAGWPTTAAQKSHFFHSHSIVFRNIGLQPFPMANSRSCRVSLPYEGGAEVQGNHHYLSDHLGLEAVFNFR